MPFWRRSRQGDEAADDSSDGFSEPTDATATTGPDDEADADRADAADAADADRADADLAISDAELEAEALAAAGRETIAAPGPAPLAAAEPMSFGAVTAPPAWGFAPPPRAEEPGGIDAGVEKSRTGFMGRLRSILGVADGAGPSWDDVEETLIAGDVGGVLSMEIVERARRRHDPGGPEAAVRAELTAILAPGDPDWMPVFSSRSRSSYSG